MPWREVCSMDEKMRLIAALASEEDRVTELCEEFSISRKTAYKWWARYRQEGPAGLKARSHAPPVVPWAITEAQAEALLACVVNIRAGG
jgi:putative transposase